MAFVVVSVESEYLPDGSFHVYSPEVPGFHVVQPDRNRTREVFFWETALPLLRDTMAARAHEATGASVNILTDIRPVEIHSFVPAEVKRRLQEQRPNAIPTRLIAEIT